MKTTEDNNLQQDINQQQSEQEEPCLCRDFYKSCMFLPDMSLKDGDWEWDETGTYKIRKTKKVFKCLYDDKKLIWDRVCPRWMDAQAKKLQSQQEQESGEANS